jgi:hypothetical protein
MNSWYALKNTNTVWARSAVGDVQIANCHNKNLPVADQRLNAQICAAAPDLMELLEDAYLSLEPQYQVRYLEISARIYSAKINAQSKDDQV